jgi:hypothetical protein
MSLSAVPCRNSRGDDVNDHDLATLRPRAQLLRIGFIVTAILLFACEREPAEARPETMTKAAVEPEPPVAEPKPKPGRRQRVNSRSQALMFEQLQAIGYVDGTYDPNSEQTGVLLNEVGRTSPGYNFYSSRHQRGANLVDMEGKLIHRWRTNQKGAWQHAELLPNGDVVVIVKEERLTRYDADSRVVWSVPGRFHHDLWIRDNEVYVLSREARVVPYVHPRTPTLIDTIEVLSLEDGSRLRKISILDLFHDSPYRFLLPAVSHHQFRGKRIQLDVLHTNHVEVLDGSLSELGPMYAEGNLLISLRNINAIVVFEPATLKVLWVWGPTNVTYQHHPTVLDNGHILLFDNGVKRSRVIEVDPLTQEIVWQYAPKAGFFSKTQGSNQRLPNGNTLVTDSNTGYVLEVTPRGRVVWKFANPRVSKKKVREAIWRMTRFAPESLAFLN